jgi:hypothetical protein
MELLSMPFKSDDLFVAMLNKYATCRSYRDIGTAVGRSGTLRFETKFIRPTKFKFEWTWVNPSNDTDKNILWRDGPAVYYRHDHKIERELSFDEALAGAGGASQMVAHQVGGLLMPDLIPTVIGGAGPYKFVATEEIHGRNCARLESDSTADTRLKFWINPQDFSLIKQEVGKSILNMTVAAALEVAKSFSTDHDLAIPENPVSSVEINWESMTFDEEIPLRELELTI